MAGSIQNQLKSSDPTVRRQAIVKLGKSLDERALPLLAGVYRSDPDPELRELALKAGKHIRKHLAAQPAKQGRLQAASDADDASSDYTPPFSSDLGEDDPGYSIIPPSSGGGSGRPNSAQGYSYTGLGQGYEDLSSEKGWFEDSSLGYEDVSKSGVPEEEVEVSYQNRQRARSYIDPVLNAQAPGGRGLTPKDRINAVKNLGKALDLDPNQARDPVVRNLVHQVMGLSPDEGVAILRGKASREDFIRSLKGKGAKAKRGAGSGAATWGDVGFDIAILFLVTVIGMVLYFLVILPQLFSMVGRYSYDPSLSSVDLQSVAPVMAIMLSLGIGLYMVISSFISNGAIHFAAVMFGGDAVLPETYHALLPIQTAITAGVLVLYAVMLMVPPDTMCLFSVLLMGTSIGGSYWMSRKLAEVHGFGSMAGCMAIIVGPILLGILTFLGLSLLGALLGVSLQNFAPMFG